MTLLHVEEREREREERERDRERGERERERERGERERERREKTGIKTVWLIAVRMRQSLAMYGKTTTIPCTRLQQLRTDVTEKFKPTKTREERIMNT